jgi:hypothetical protein
MSLKTVNVSVYISCEISHTCAQFLNVCTGLLNNLNYGILKIAFSKLFKTSNILTFFALLILQ